jgi:hypothetical protein
MAADLTSLSQVLKEFYLTPLAEQLNNENMVASLLEVTAENLEGLKAVLPLHYGRSSGISSRFEGGTIATSGKQKYARAEFDLKYHYARVQVSGPSISKTKSDRGSFLQALKSELDFIKNDLQLDQSRQYYGDGSGVIGVIASTSSTVATLTSAEPISKGYLYIGMSCDTGTAAASTNDTTANIITDLDVTVPSVTFTSAVANTANNVIVRAGNVSSSTDVTTNAEIDAGLLRLLGTSVVGGIDPTATARGFWKGVVTDKVAAPDIALDDLMVMSNTLQNAGSKSSDQVVMTTPGLVRRLFQTEDFKDSVRFVNSTTLTGGFEQISFAAGNGPMKINADRLAPWGDVMFVDKSQVKVFSPADWDFLSRDGLTIRWVVDVDAFQAVLFKYANMGTARRNTSGLLKNYTDTGF